MTILGRPDVPETGAIRDDPVYVRVLDDRRQMLPLEIGRRDRNATTGTIEFDQGGGAEDLGLGGDEDRFAVDRR